MSSRSRVEVLGIGIDPVTMPEALAAIEQFIAEGVPRIVVTADASGIVAAQSDASWRKIIEEADLVTPDSAGILWASEKVGEPIRERVSGVELVYELASLSAKKGYRVFLLGAAPGVAEKAAAQLANLYPGFQLAGVRDGFFRAEEEPAVAQQVREAKVDILFVAMGIPKQEKFIANYLYEMAAKVSIGVGGSFDVVSGNVRRAPRILQKLRLEWLWRLILNPRKWRKVAALPKFWWLVMRSGRPHSQ